MTSRLAVGLSVVIKPSDELSIHMGLFAVPVTSPNGRRGVAFAGSSAVACNAASFEVSVGPGEKKFIQRP